MSYSKCVYEEDKAIVYSEWLSIEEDDLTENRDYFLNDVPNSIYEEKGYDPFRFLIIYRLDMEVSEDKDHCRFIITFGLP